MIQVTPQMKIYLHYDKIDFRYGVDGLAGICKYKMNLDPMSGALFVFTNRARSGIKILVYDGSGFWACHKRLSQGKLKWWPQGKEVYLDLAAKELQILIWNGNPSLIGLPDDWKKIT